MAIKNIIVAVEDTFFGGLIVDFAKRHNWSEGCHFKVVHVVEPPPAFVEAPPNYFADALEQGRALGRKLTDEIAQLLKEQIPQATVEPVLLEGLPKEELLDLAQSWPADLMVMGSHGRRGIRRFLLGSVSTAISSHAPCSVVIVKQPQATGGGAVKTGAAKATAAPAKK